MGNKMFLVRSLYSNIRNHRNHSLLSYLSLMFQIFGLWSITHIGQLFLSMLLERTIASCVYPLFID